MLFLIALKMRLNNTHTYLEIMQVSLIIIYDIVIQKTESFV